MLSFQFSRITFAKTSKYVFLVSTQEQTKRTDVCHSWTSSPTFQEEVQFSQWENNEIYKIKACQATIDRKLKIVGFAAVESKQIQTQKQTELNGQTLLLEKDLQFIQVVQGKDIIVGRCHLQVKKKQLQGKQSRVIKEKTKPNNNYQDAKSLQVSAVNTQINEKVLNSARIPQQVKNSPRKNQSKLQQSRLTEKNNQDMDFDSDLEIKSDEEDQKQNDCSIKFFIHGGTNFYLGSCFSVQLVWGQNYAQTRYIKDKIIPQWAQSLGLIGNSQQSVTLNIIDEKNNILEWTRLSLRNIRKIYPYHLKIIFRQQYMGDRPMIYLSMMREDLPKFSILDKQIKLIINYEGQNIRNPLQYLLIQSKQQLEVPTFFDIDLRKYSSLDQVNKFIENVQIGDYNWTNFIPLQTGKRSMTMFKSQLSKCLNLYLVTIKNWNLLFSQQKTQKKVQSVSVVQRRPNFQQILKKIYYYQQVHAVGKITQIYSENNLQEGSIKDANTWRTMTKNYILRNNLLNTSIQNLEILKNQITSKGEELIKLKKILNEVKSINLTLRQKEKSSLVSEYKNRKQKLQADNFKITDIEMMLYEKQAELQFKKKRNDEMSLRMDSLNVMQQDTTEIDKQIIKNSKTILEQQERIKLLLLMRKQNPKQKQLISKLQTIFQKKQLDNEMNSLLKMESNKLSNIRKKKRADLQNVYHLLKQKNNHQNSLQSKVQNAEAELIKLNEFYAKLTGL